MNDITLTDGNIGCDTVAFDESLSGRHSFQTLALAFFLACGFSLTGCGSSSSGGTVGGGGTGDGNGGNDTCEPNKLEFSYLGPNELTVQLTTTEDIANVGFAISSSATAPSNPSGAGYITRDFVADTARYVYLSTLYGIPATSASVTAEHFMKENSDYYLHVYKGGSSLCNLSFKTAKFTTLDTQTRRDNANPTGYYGWEHYFANGKITSGSDATDISIASSASDIPIEYKKGEHIMIPLRVVIPRFSTQLNDVNILLVRISMLNTKLSSYSIAFTYINTTGATAFLGESFPNSKFFEIDSNLPGSGNVDYVNLLGYIHPDDIIDDYIKGANIDMRLTTQFTGSIRGNATSAKFMTVVDK